MASTLVYCVRHGQTAENAQGIIQGQLDTQLDGIGIEQAAAVGWSLKDIKFDTAFSSDLTRAADTASALLKHHPGVPLHKTAILRERFMGNLQGQPFQDQSLKRLPADETVETVVTFRERILKFWDETVIPYAKDASGDRPACMLVVSHGAFIGLLVRTVIEYRDIVKSSELKVKLAWCPNASVTVVEVQRDGTGTLKSYGDISHIVMPVTAGNADDVLV